MDSLVKRIEDWKGRILRRVSELELACPKCFTRQGTTRACAKCGTIILPGRSARERARYLTIGVSCLVGGIGIIVVAGVSGTLFGLGAFAVLLLGPIVGLPIFGLAMIAYSLFSRTLPCEPYLALAAKYRTGNNPAKAHFECLAYTFAIALDTKSFRGVISSGKMQDAPYEFWKKHRANPQIPHDLRSVFADLLWCHTAMQYLFSGITGFPISIARDRLMEVTTDSPEIVECAEILQTSSGFDFGAELIAKLRVKAPLVSAALDSTQQSSASP